MDGDFVTAGVEENVADSQNEFENNEENLEQDTGDETGTELDGDAESVEPHKGQDPKTNAAFAQMRREAEQLKREIQSRDQWVSDTFGQSHGIHTWQQYQQAVQQTQQQQMQQYQKQQEDYYREQGYDPSVIRQILRNDPTFQQMAQQNQLLQQQVQQQQMQQQVQGQFMELQKNYPEIKNPNDIPEHVRDRWGRGGVTLLEAYELTNKNAIKQAVKQKTLNSVKNRSHLKTEGDGQGDSADVNIAPETLQMYLDMGMDKKQAMKHYKKLYG